MEATQFVIRAVAFYSYNVFSIFTVCNTIVYFKFPVQYMYQEFRDEKTKSLSPDTLLSSLIWLYSFAFHQGIYDGMTLDEIKQMDPEEHKVLEEHPFNYRYPRGEVIQSKKNAVYCKVSLKISSKDPVHCNLLTTIVPSLYHSAKSRAHFKQRILN